MCSSLTCMFKYALYPLMHSNYLVEKDVFWAQKATEGGDGRVLHRPCLHQDKWWVPFHQGDRVVFSKSLNLIRHGKQYHQHLG